MGWFSSGKSDEDRNAEMDKEILRSIKGVKASQLEWAEKKAAENPDDPFAQAILDASRRNL